VRHVITASAPPVGEPLPQPTSGGFGFFAETGIEPADMRQAVDLPNEILERITRLVITEGLVASGNASWVIEVGGGPRVWAARRVAVEWVDATPYASV
jgi:hypothetical protein